MKKESPNAAQTIARPTIFDRVHPAAFLPSGRVGDSSFGLYCCDLTESDRPNRITLPPHTISRPINTGLSYIPSPGQGVRVLTPLSSLRSGILVVGAEGIGSSHYGTEIKLFLYNTRHEATRIIHGDLIAELEFFHYELSGPAEWAAPNGADEDDD